MTRVAGFAWLVVAAAGVRSAIVVDDGDWTVTYTIFSLALLAGAVLSIALAARATRGCNRPWLRMVGLGVSALGGLACVVAWALPLWMTLLGVGFAIVAVASAPGPRRPLTLLAAGQLVGIVVMFAGIAAEVGRRDEWGDYPAAGGIAVVTVAVMTIVALLGLGRTVGQPAGTQQDMSLAGVSGTA